MILFYFYPIFYRSDALPEPKHWEMVDGTAPSQMVGVSASVNLPLHHKAQKFSSSTGSPGWSRKKGHKTVVVVVVYFILPLNGHYTGQWTTCVSWHPQLRTGGFCWSKVLLSACPCWWQLAHSDYGEDARVLLSGVTCTIAAPSKEAS